MGLAVTNQRVRPFSCGKNMRTQNRVTLCLYFFLWGKMQKALFQYSIDEYFRRGPTLRSGAKEVSLPRFASAV
ncbi:hypothetical protein E4U48_002364 [Claviceps purpurea]|nr:hypothetical protein E4U48_002364 [Claviceps purpurea]